MLCVAMRAQKDMEIDVSLAAISYDKMMMIESFIFAIDEHMSDPFCWRLDENRHGHTFSCAEMPY